MEIIIKTKACPDFRRKDGEKDKRIKMIPQYTYNIAHRASMSIAE